MGGERHAPAALPSGMTRYPLQMKLNNNNNNMFIFFYPASRNVSALPEDGPLRAVTCSSLTV